MTKILVQLVLHCFFVIFLIITISSRLKVTELLNLIRKPFISTGDEEFLSFQRPE